MESDASARKARGLVQHLKCWWGFRPEFSLGDDCTDGLAEGTRFADREPAGLRGLVLASHEELLREFTIMLGSRRVNDRMRMLIDDVVGDIAISWGQEFCRAITLKLNTCYLLPFCDSLPNYMRKEMPRHHLPSAGVQTPFQSLRVPQDQAVCSDERSAKLRASIEQGIAQQTQLQSIASRLHAHMTESVEVHLVPISPKVQVRPLTRVSGGE